MGMFVHRPVLMANLAGILVGFGMFANFLGVSYLVQMPEALTGFGFDASDPARLRPVPAARRDRLAARLARRRPAGPPPRPPVRARAWPPHSAPSGFAWLALDHATAPR